MSDTSLQLVLEQNAKNIGILTKDVKELAKNVNMMISYKESHAELQASMKVHREMLQNMAIQINTCQNNQKQSEVERKRNEKFIAIGISTLIGLFGWMATQLWGKVVL